jgi:hypothetical protein
MKNKLNLPVLKRSVITIAISSLLGSAPAYALDLEQSFALAKKNDPKYQAAQAEKQATLAESAKNWVAYAPTYTYSQQQLATLSVTSTTRSVNQPLFDASKGASVAQGKSRSNLADASFNSQTQDLALRTFKAVSDIVLATEAIRANDGRISALESQYLGAKRK